MSKVTKQTIIKEDTAAPSGAEQDDKQATLARVIWFLAGILLALLALRFLLSLLGANRSNGFADIIYDASYPFVAPFFGLFNYEPLYGNARFELFTLIAMLVYCFVAFGLARLVTINKDY